MLRYCLFVILLVHVFGQFERPWMKEDKSKSKIPGDNIVINLKHKNSYQLECPLNSTKDEEDIQFARWFKKDEYGGNKELVFEEGKYDFPTLSSFWIQNLSPADEGLFSCKSLADKVIKNFRLVIVDFTDTTPSTILAKPPIWRVVPVSNKIVGSNERAIIVPCKARGTGVVVKVYRLKDDGSIFKEFDNEAVIIHRPTSEDTGNYKCVAQNSAGKIEKMFIIQVRVNGGLSEWNAWGPCDKDCGWGIKTRRRECNNPEPAGGGSYCRGKMTERNNCYERSCQQPRLTKFGYEITDDALILFCVAKGIPKPTVLWRFNGNRFSETYNYRSGNFRIPKARARSGSYSCTISNSVGYFTMYITIRI